MILHFWYSAIRGGCFLALLLGVFLLPCSGSTDSLQADSVGFIESDSAGTSVVADATGTGGAAERESAVKKSTPVVYGTLDKVIVVDDRRRRLLASTQSLTIVKPEEWAGTNKSIADILAAQTGVQTRKYGGMGSFQSVSIRGVEGKEVLVLLDGVPLNSSMGGAVDLGTFNSDMIEEIELYKGIVPGEFGGNALGGVVNIKSKTSLKADNVAIHSVIGAYGSQRYTFEANRFFTESLKVFGALSYTKSDNDWLYIDRNRTPYNVTDDTIATVKNHQYDNVDVRLYPTYYLKSNRAIVSGVTWSRSNSGIPGLEGSANKTAENTHEMLFMSARLQRKNGVTPYGITVTPEIGYTKINDNLFWTSLDSSMGTSHGALSTVPNAYCKTESELHVVNVSIISDIGISDNIDGHLTLSGKHSAVKNSSVASHLGHGTDWPGNSQEASLAADINAIYPIGQFTPGATVTSSVKAIRNATEGGQSEVLSKTYLPSDVIEYPWSIRCGLSSGIGQYVKLYANVGKYMSVPGLREKFGYNGTVEPNPDLKSEHSVSFEAGGRVINNNFNAEAVVFQSHVTDGIVIQSDGTMSQPVNIAESRTTGLEVSLGLYLKKMFRFETRTTLQKAENLSRWYSYYGNQLINEPNLTTMGKIEIGPFWNVTTGYWAEYRSVFYRDLANIKRIPNDENENGTLYHNVKASWNATKSIKLSASLCNVNTRSFRYESLVSGCDESGYSWIVFPQNEWSISADIIF